MRMKGELGLHIPKKPCDFFRLLHQELWSVEYTLFISWHRHLRKRLPGSIHMENPYRKHQILSVPITFRTIAHVYDPDDPTPEGGRDLTDKAEDTITRAILDTKDPLHAAGKYSLEIRLPSSDLSMERETDIPDALHAYFLRRADELHQDSRLTRRVGLREFSLTIGVCIPSLLGIVACDPFPHEPLAIILQNVLLIFCWVVIWQPFQSLVFDRWTLSEKEKMFRQIAGMEIRIIPA